jgi:PAS domain S-box-containing protein
MTKEQKLQLKRSAAMVRDQAEQFTVFKNATQDGFMLVGPKGELLDVNESYCRMTGYAEEELRRMRVQDVEAAEKGDDTAKHIEHIVKYGSDFFQSRHRRKDGSSFDVEVSVIFWKERNQFFSFVRDITQRIREQRELEQLKNNLENLVAKRTNELRYALDAAKKANRAKTRFLSRMSHELRTPLNAIIGFSQLFEIEGTTETAEENRDYVREILKAGNNLLNLIDTMLEFSAVNEKLHELNIETVECTPVILESIKVMEPAAEERKITLVPEMKESCSVLADRRRLLQILQNLISNAVKYNREGGTVTVTCVSHAGCVRITVADTGNGIPIEYHDVIFEPFEKAETDFDGKPGAGIGLAMTKQLVEEMGGIIGMESREGSGSSFWFELPYENKACTEGVLV